MIIETRAVEPFMKNGFVLGCEETREGVLVDPGEEVDLLLQAAETHRLSIQHILLTHAHMDHITGVAHAKKALGVPIWLHEADNFLYRAVVQQGLAFGFHIDPQPPVDSFYENDDPRNGFVRFSRPMVVRSPWPGYTTVSSGNRNSTSRIERSSVS
jgi:glyoxylase-like metal-dependent hydrolase (beta-lactamase superfamily II)